MLHQYYWFQGIPNAHQCPNMCSRSSMSRFKPYRESLLSQLLKGLKIDCARAKVNCGPHTVNVVPQNLTSHSSGNYPGFSKFSLIYKSKTWVIIPFQTSHLQGKNGHLQAKKVKLWFFLIKIKTQKSYFIKTCWNMKFVSSRNSKVKFYLGKVKF